MDNRAIFARPWIGAALVVPQVLLVFTFFYWPAGEALFWSVTLEPPFGGGNQFVGWQNFSQVFQDPTYWGSIGTSIVFAVSTAVTAMGLGLVLAALVDRQLPGYRAYRFLYFIPYAISSTAVGLTFRFIFAPDSGFVSAINDVFPNLWNPATDGKDALVLIILAFAWKYVGYAFVFCLAGLQAIPRSLHEAAALDGARVVRRFFDVQLPLITPTIFFLTVIILTASFVESFAIIDVTTRGGPARSTNLMVYKIYNDGFVSKDYSLAAAQSIVLMGLVMVLTFFQFRFVERRVHYS
jgi:sn-glycerol 3-phosphate transport system permease protein